MSAADQPVLRVVRGKPTDVELAALVAIVAAFSAAGRSADRPGARSRWAAPRHRPSLRSGPGGWAASGTLNR